MNAVSEKINKTEVVIIFMAVFSILASCTVFYQWSSMNVSIFKESTRQINSHVDATKNQFTSADILLEKVFVQEGLFKCLYEHQNKAVSVANKYHYKPQDKAQNEINEVASLMTNFCVEQELNRIVKIHGGDFKASMALAKFYQKIGLTIPKEYNDVILQASLDDIEAGTNMLLASQ